MGLLGLAYPKVSRPDASVLSWIDALIKEKQLNTAAFVLELCGCTPNTDNIHFGNFDVLGSPSPSSDFHYSAAIQHEVYYDVMVVNIRVNNEDLPVTCYDINKNKSIIDSGSTNLILPPKVYNAIIESLYKYTVANNIPLTLEFWNPTEISCFDWPLNWDSLPIIDISIAHNDTSYFNIGLPGSSYIKQVYNSENNDLQKYCYNVAIQKSIENGNVGTILGVTTMEGFKIIFNRTSKTIDYEISSCGPNVTLRGLYRSSMSFKDKCVLSSNKKSHFDALIIHIVLITSLSTIAICGVAVLIFYKYKKKYWTTHVFVTMSRTSQLIED